MQIKIISCETLQEYMYHDDCLLIDLREKEDYENGHLPGAIWANWETLEEDMEEILAAQDKTISHIIVYCERGNISLLTARDLARHGYSVISVGGGYRHCGRALAIPAGHH